MDRRLTVEDLDWLRKLRSSRAANEPSDIPTSVVRRLTLLACAEANGRGHCSITRRGRDELVDRELETKIG